MFDEAGGGGQVLTADQSMLHAAGMECGKTAEGLTTMLNNMLSNLEPMKTALRGLGGNAYQQAEQGVRDQMAILNNALYEIGDKVGIARSQYEQGDEEIEDTLRAVGAEDNDIQSLLNP